MRITDTLGINGQPLIEWAGFDAWRIRHVGDFLVSLEWAIVPGSRTAQRACVIGRPKEGRIVLPGAVAGNWHPRCYLESDRPAMLEFDQDDKPTGRPTKALLWDAQQSVQLLGYTSDDRTAIRHYVDAVLNAMIDMVRMPAAQAHVRKRMVAANAPAMEITAKRGDKTIEVQI